MGLHFIVPIERQNYFFSIRNTKKFYKKTDNFTPLYFNLYKYKKRGEK